MPLKVTLIQYIFVPKLQPFQNGGVQTSEVDAKLAPLNMGPCNFVC
jgi:hypothetical protein